MTAAVLFLEEVRLLMLAYALSKTFALVRLKSYGLPDTPLV